MKCWEDDLPSASKYKKKVSKSLTGRKYMTRSNGISFANGGLDYGEYALDREIQRHLSKLIKKHLQTQSETSDDRSSKDDKSNSESTTLNMESELDL